MDGPGMKPPACESIGTLGNEVVSGCRYFNDWDFCHKFATLKCGNVVISSCLR